MKISYAFDRAAYNQGQNAKFNFSVEEEVAPPMIARGPNAVAKSPEYIVRRLTPTECARLQGFPDWWCSDLDTETPSEEDIAFWTEVFETHRQITGESSKPKTRSQIIKFLQHPHSDSAEYKMWGNGVALPNVFFVLAGIEYYANLNLEDNKQ